MYKDDFAYFFPTLICKYKSYNPSPYPLPLPPILPAVPCLKAKLCKDGFVTLIRKLLTCAIIAVIIIILNGNSRFVVRYDLTGRLFTRVHSNLFKIRFHSDLIVFDTLISHSLPQLSCKFFISCGRIPYLFFVGKISLWVLVAGAFLSIVQHRWRALYACVCLQAPSPGPFEI